MDKNEIADALEEGIKIIETFGWHNIEKDIYIPGDPTAGHYCAVTSLLAARPHDPEVLIAAVVAMAEHLGDSPANLMPGTFVGKWNDAQDSPEPVIAMMREVAQNLRNGLAP